MSEELVPGKPETYAANLMRGEVTIDILLKERDMMLDLYKHHLKLLLEANVFIYAVTGALASFVVTHTDIPSIRFVLLLPAVVCVGFILLFGLVSRKIKNTEAELAEISDALKTNTFPALDALPIGLWVSATALIVVVVLLIVGFCRFPVPSSAMPAIHGGFGVI